MKQILLSLTLLGCFECWATAQESPYLDAEAYSLYSSLMLKDWPFATLKAKKFVIQQQTSDAMSDMAMCLGSVKEARFQPVISKFKELSKTRWLLQRKFDISLPYETVSEAEINKLIRRNDSPVSAFVQFYSKYPDSGGYIFMSPMAFNTERNIAIFYFGYWCGTACGEGLLSVLEKKNGKWEKGRLGGQGCYWIS